MIDYQLTLGYAGLCLVLQTFYTYAAPLFFPNFSKMTAQLQRTGSNKLLSTTHACIMFSHGVYYWVYLNPNMILSEFPTEFERFTVHIMTGYLIFDTFYEVFTDRDGGALVHHVLGFISHISILYYNHGSGCFYLMMVYLAELSSPFLNISWLMNYANLTHSPIFQVVMLLVVVTFLFCRIFLGPYLLCHLIFNWVIGNTSVYLYYLNIFILVGFNLLNFIWYAKILYIVKQKLINPSRKVD